jgi:hypothetical protein
MLQVAGHHYDLVWLGELGNEMLREPMNEDLYSHTCRELGRLFHLLQDVLFDTWQVPNVEDLIDLIRQEGLTDG